MTHSPGGTTAPSDTFLERSFHAQRLPRMLYAFTLNLLEVI